MACITEGSTSAPHPRSVLVSPALAFTWNKNSPNSTLREKVTTGNITNFVLKPIQSVWQTIFWIKASGSSRWLIDWLVGWLLIDPFCTEWCDWLVCLWRTTHSEHLFQTRQTVDMLHCEVRWVEEKTGCVEQSVVLPRVVVLMRDEDDTARQTNKLRLEDWDWSNKLRIEACCNSPQLTNRGLWPLCFTVFVYSVLFCVFQNRRDVSDVSVCTDWQTSRTRTVCVSKIVLTFFIVRFVRFCHYYMIKHERFVSLNPNVSQRLWCHRKSVWRYLPLDTTSVINIPLDTTSVITSVMSQKVSMTVRSAGPVSYTHLRAHET